MICSKMSTNTDGQTVLTIEIEGFHDIFVVASALAAGRPEMVAHARRAFQHIARKIGIEDFTILDNTLNGGWVVKRRLHRRPREDAAP